MADILLQCGNCSQQMAVDRNLGGRRISCLGCQAPITIPTADILLDCPGCSVELAVGASASGKTFACPECEAELDIPLLKEPRLRLATPKDKTHRIPCPYCQHPLASDSVFCVHCGTNLTTGKPVPSFRHKEKRHSNSSINSASKLVAALFLLTVLFSAGYPYLSSVGRRNRDREVQRLRDEEEERARINARGLYNMHMRHSQFHRWSAADWYFISKALSDKLGDGADAMQLQLALLSFERYNPPSLRPSSMIYSHMPVDEIIRMCDMLLLNYRVNPPAGQGHSYIRNVELLKIVLRRAKELGWGAEEEREYVARAAEQKRKERQEQREAAARQQEIAIRREREARERRERQQESQRLREEDRRRQHQERLEYYIRTFTSPVGRVSRVTLAAGTTVDGDVVAVDNRSVTLRRGSTHITLQRNNLSYESRIQCFASDYAEHRMKSQVH